ncbi:hypothetical protein [Achromobacter sp.]|uniref:hypothetical protein n=2 Tax=Alcaligenaceae TaxID=506 RepID=UPI0006C872B4|nr:hypothetical protein [Achromobacter sp.]
MTMQMIIEAARSIGARIKREFWRDPNSLPSASCAAAFAEGEWAWKFGSLADNRYAKRTPEYRAFKDGYDRAAREEMMVW